MAQVSLNVSTFNMLLKVDITKFYCFGTSLRLSPLKLRYSSKINPRYLYELTLSSTSLFKEINNPCRDMNENLYS